MSDLFLKKEKFTCSFPYYLVENISTWYEEKEFKLSLPNFSDGFNVKVNDEILFIPNRVCLIEKHSFSKYSLIQQHILYCYYTRHQNGFIREKYLEKIIKLNKEWVIPYIIKLLGEYVIEILHVIYKSLDSLDLVLYKEFILNNLDFYKLTSNRIVSYWDCYYRRNIYKYKRDYVGFKILDFIDNNILNM